MAGLAGCATAPAPRPYRASLLLPSVGPVPLRPGELEGRVVLVKFLATWCLPCLSELASVLELQRRYGGKDFTVVAVGMDREGALVLEPFARQYELPFPLLLADERIRSGQSAFGPITALPTTFLLGRDGQVRLAYEGVAPPAPLGALIEKAMKE